MLQQTQVSTVIPYFERFLQRFPDLETLADAPTDDVMAQWAGLGYYSRARNLHRAAQQCSEAFDGQLPRDFEQLLALPGIGRSTAGAIAAQAYGDRQPILDGNAKRVLARHDGIEGWPGKSAVAKQLWESAERYLPDQQIVDYTQAIMDLGATVCTLRKPKCDQCPFSKNCVANKSARQHTLPGKRTRRALPQRSCWVALSHDDRHRLLLERRPNHGIWGGLWCLPTHESDELPSGTVATAAPVSHAFTHFKLDLKPVLLRQPKIADQEQRWCSAKEVATLGLPRPIERIVKDYFEENIKWQESSTA